MGWAVKATPPAGLFSEKNTRYPLYRRLGGPQNGSGLVRTIIMMIIVKMLKLLPACYMFYIKPDDVRFGSKHVTGCTLNFALLYNKWQLWLPVCWLVNSYEQIFHDATYNTRLSDSDIPFFLLYAFFWVITRRLEFKCRRFGTICLLHLHRQIDVSRNESRNQKWYWKRFGSK